MQHPVNVDFVVAPIDVPLDSLADLFKIVTHPPGGDAVLHLRHGEMMIEIGEIVVYDNVIHIAPNSGIGECRRHYLMSAAESAFLGVCHEDLGWKRVVEGDHSWWSTWVSVPVAAGFSPHAVEGPVGLGLPTPKNALRAPQSRPDLPSVGQFP